MARSVTWAGAGLRPAPSRRSSSFLQRAGSGAARRSRPLVLPARTMPANNRLQQIRPGPSASLRARSAGQLNRTLSGVRSLTLAALSDQLSAVTLARSARLRRTERTRSSPWHSEHSYLAP